MAKNVKIAFLGDVSQLKRAIAEADQAVAKQQSSFEKMGEKFSSAGNKMLVATGVLGAGLWNVGDAAAGLNAAVSTSEMVFGSASSKIREMGETAAESFGLSAREFHQFSNLFGSFFKNMGFGQDAAADLSVQMIQLAADMSAAFDSTPQEAVEALTAAMRGEMDPIEKFGVSLRQADIDAKILALGLDTSTTALEKNAKATAVLALMQEQTSSISGQFARESDSVSGQMAKMKAGFEDAKAELGQNLIPVMLKAIDVGNTFIGWVTTANKATGGLLSTFAGVGTVGMGFVAVISKVAGVGAQAVAGWQKLDAKLREFGENRSWSGYPKTAEQAAAANAKWNNTVTKLGQGIGALGAALTAGAVGMSIWNAKQQELTSHGAEVQQLLNDRVKSGAMTMEKLANGIQAANTQQKEFVKAYNDVSIWELWDYDARAASKTNAETALQLEVSMISLQAQAQALAQHYGITADEALRMIGANKELGKSATDTAGMHKLQADSLKELEKELKDASSATFELYENQFKSLDAGIRWKDSLAGMAAELRENGWLLNWNTAGGRANLEMLSDLSKQAVEAGKREIEMGHGVDAAKAAVNQHVAELRGQAFALGLNKDQVDAFLGSLGLLPDQVTTNFQALGLADAAYYSGVLAANLQKIKDGPWGGGFLSNVGDWLQNVERQRATGRAIGGTVNAGQTYLVGERGPELLTMGSRSGSVTPARETAEAMGGGDLHVTLTLDGRELARTLIPEFRRQEVARL